MIIQLDYAFVITMQIAVYYDVIYCTVHYDIIRPDFACALITEHILVLNFCVNTQITFSQYLWKSTQE